MYDIMFVRVYFVRSNDDILTPSTTISRRCATVLRKYPVVVKKKKNHFRSKGLKTAENLWLQEFLSFPNVSMLYLHGNNIDDIVEVYKLRNLGKLRTLTLNKNPMCLVCEHYRSIVINLVPRVQKLDNVVVVRSERSPSRSALIGKRLHSRLAAAYPEDFAARKRWRPTDRICQHNTARRVASNECFVPTTRTGTLTCYHDHVRAQALGLWQHFGLWADASTDNLIIPVDRIIIVQHYPTCTMSTKIAMMAIRTAVAIALKFKFVYGHHPDSRVYSYGWGAR